MFLEVVPLSLCRKSIRRRSIYGRNDSALSLLLIKHRRWPFAPLLTTCRHETSGRYMMKYVFYLRATTGLAQKMYVGATQTACSPPAAHTRRNNRGRERAHYVPPPLRCERHRLQEPTVFQPLKVKGNHPLKNRHVPVSHGSRKVSQERQLGLFWFDEDGIRKFRRNSWQR